MTWTEHILHVDMDAFFVEVHRLSDPDLIGSPVVVGGAGPRGVVASASYEARGFGISSAMPMSRARRLCPDLIIVPPEHNRYREVSVRLFALLRGVTPLVEGVSIDEAFMDVGGLRLHYPSSLAVAHHVRKVMRDELGLASSVGVAGSKFVAKLASERAKPDGVVQVPVAEQQRFLDPLDVRAIWGVGSATQAVLSSLGIETIADLAASELRPLERALGPAQARHLLALARGEDPRRVEPDSEMKSVSVEQTFEVDITDEDRLLTELRAMADRVGARLRRAGVRGATIEIKVRYASFETVSRSHTIEVATDTGAEIYRHARRLFAGVSPGKVRLLGVGVTSLVSGPRQLGLTEERWEQIDQVSDEIRQRYGEHLLGFRPSPEG